MPPTSPDEVSFAYVEALNTDLGCISRSRLISLAPPGCESRASTDEERRSYVTLESPIRLRAGGSLGLLLDMQSSYAVRPDVSAGTDPDRATASERSATGVVSDRWRVETISHEYRVLDRTEQELLVWHYQPGDGFRGPDHPHLHVSAEVTARTPGGAETTYRLDKRPLPTGIVGLAAIVRSLIEEFGVAAGTDWPEHLARGEGSPPPG